MGFIFAVARITHMGFKRKVARNAFLGFIGQLARRSNLEFTAAMAPLKNRAGPVPARRVRDAGTSHWAKEGRHGPHKGREREPEPLLLQSRPFGCRQLLSRSR
jgi:hypothetical protein